MIDSARDALSSITLSRDAQGVYGWEIKLYFDAEHDDGGQVFHQLRRLDQTLRSMYQPDPLPF